MLCIGVQRRIERDSTRSTIRGLFKSLPKKLEDIWHGSSKVHRDSPQHAYA